MQTITELFKNYPKTNGTKIIIDYLLKLEKEGHFKTFAKLDEYIMEYVQNDIQEMEHQNYSDEDIFPFIVNNEKLVDSYFKQFGYDQNLSFMENLCNAQNNYNYRGLSEICIDVQNYFHDQKLKNTDVFNIVHNSKDYEIQYTFEFDKILYLICELEGFQYTINYVCDDDSFKVKSDLVAWMQNDLKAIENKKGL